MKSNNQLKFDYGDYSPRKTADQETIQNEFKHMFEPFVYIVEQAFVDAKKIISVIPPLQRDKSLFSTLLNGLVCGRMYDAFPKQCTILKHGRIGCIINETVAFFKKLDDTHKPNHVATTNSILLEENLQIKNKSENSVIWIGYSMTEDKSCITGVFVSHFRNGKRAWFIDLYEWIKNESNKEPVASVEGVNPVLRPNVQKKQEDSEKKQEGVEG